MSHLKPLLAGTALACTAAAASAQQAPSPPAATQTVVVTGNPLAHDEPIQPTAVLSGAALAQRRASTLGETLDGLPGLSATGFGPNASRPVIRGLDGDRVRLLDNGGASVDASNLSFDHASASDPLITERVEVLRGPAALLYGGNATGGVVNSIDNRIPRDAAPGLGGRAELRLGGAAAERAGAAVLEGGSAIDDRNAWMWHADVFGRDAGDQRVPRYTPVADGQALAPTTRVRNSAARADGGAFGGGWAGASGYFGASVDSTHSRYGTTVEPDVFIRMQRDRAALAGEWRDLPGPVSQLSLQASHTRYEHQEVEGSGAVGTTFTSRGSELRLQAQHAPLGALRGVFGVQAETLDFAALGEEAFVPDTRTRNAAAFVLEELHTGPVMWSAGARAEHVRVSSDGDSAAAAAPRFGAAQQRSFTPASFSLGARVGGPQGWQFSASVGHTERAPAYYELFANGLHVATAVYERGDTTLGVEHGRHVELGAAWSRDGHSVKASVFSTRFGSFISLDASGAQVAGADGTLPEYRFGAVRARMNGFELEGRTRLVSAPLALDLSGSWDAVRGDNLSSGEPLPRLPPQRLRVALEASTAAWHAGMALRAAARQQRVPTTDSATPGYTMLDAWAGGTLGGPLRWFARLNNATNRLATSAATIATMRALAPLPARALTVGLRAQF